MKQIEIKINDKVYIIKQSFRAYLLYEEMTKKQLTEVQSFSDIIALLYCTFKGCNKTFEYSYDEFLDIIDENPEIFTKFNEFNSGDASNNEKKM